MTKTRMVMLVASLVTALTAPSTMAATAQTPDDAGDDVSAAATSSMIESVELHQNWVRECIETDNSSTANGTDALMHNCSRRGGNTWTRIRVGESSGGTPLYELRNVHSGWCLSLEDTESDPSNGRDVQQETCYTEKPRDGQDARWWFKSLGNGQYLIRPYLINSRNGQYPCLEADNWDTAGQTQVQVYTCGDSRFREWRLPAS